MELVNKFDNALAGVAGDGGAGGPVINMGNTYETNKFWNIKTCQTTEGDQEQPGAARDVLDVELQVIDGDVTVGVLNGVLCLALAAHAYLRDPEPDVRSGQKSSSGARSTE